jgi:hypothetical protein
MAPLAWLLVGVGLWFLLATPDALVGERRVRDANRFRCLLIGDSLAVGLSGPLKQEVERTDAGAPGYWLICEAKSGATMADYNSHISEYIRNGNYDTVFVSLGTNDCRDATSARCRQFAIDAKRIQWLGDSYGTFVVFIVPGWLSQPWLERIRSGIESFGGKIIETRTPELSRDAMHPTVKGYAQWASMIATAWRVL